MSKLNIILNTGTDRLTEAKAKMRVYGIEDICPEWIYVIIAHALWEDSEYSMSIITFLVKFCFHQDQILPKKTSHLQGLFTL